MFETNTPTASSPGEYATALQKQLQTAYELVRERLSKSHIHQKELYNHKVHGQPHKLGDLVWLHSTVAKKPQSQATSSVDKTLQDSEEVVRCHLPYSTCSDKKPMESCPL